MLEDVVMMHFIIDLELGLSPLLAEAEPAVNPIRRNCSLAIPEP
jgi:hypothetical protein